LLAVSRHHIVRMLGALLGSRAEVLPVWLCRRLSLEGRGGPTRGLSSARASSRHGRGS
jgi:hypothetical protein